MTLKNVCSIITVTFNYLRHYLMITKTLNQAILVGLVSIFAFSSAGADDVKVEEVDVASHTSRFYASLEETRKRLKTQRIDPVYFNLIDAQMNMIKFEYELRIAKLQRELDLAKHNENID